MWRSQYMMYDVDDGDDDADDNNMTSSYIAWRLVNTSWAWRN